MGEGGGHGPPDRLRPEPQYAAGRRRRVRYLLRKGHWGADQRRPPQRWPTKVGRYQVMPLPTVVGNAASITSSARGIDGP
ncbi:hypothetical protein G6F21_014670 [Rhizopus arrhizus]|nr:hypothetical protein G6F21_014670 [Rhizopus arrhizus]